MVEEGSDRIGWVEKGLVYASPFTSTPIYPFEDEGAHLEMLGCASYHTEIVHSPQPDVATWHITLSC